MNERRREAFDGLRRALGERPEGFSREEWAVALSLLSPAPLPPGTTAARGTLAIRARECFPGYSAPQAMRAYLEARDRPHVLALVTDFRALEALDVMAQRGMWRERLNLAGSVAEVLHPPPGMTTAEHLSTVGDLSGLAKIAAAVAAVAKVAADFDALQAPRTRAEEAGDVESTSVADAHAALARGLEQAAESYRD